MITPEQLAELKRLTLPLARWTPESFLYVDPVRNCYAALVCNLAPELVIEVDRLTERLKDMEDELTNCSARIVELEAEIKAAADAQEKWRQLWTAGLVDEAPEA